MRSGRGVREYFALLMGGGFDSVKMIRRREGGLGGVRMDGVDESTIYR